MASVTKLKINIQSGTDRTMYATWSFAEKYEKKLDEYKVKWYYHTGQNTWFDGDNSSTKTPRSVYTAPSNAKKVKVKVTPVAKKKKDANGKQKYEFTGEAVISDVYELKAKKVPTVAPIKNLNLKIQSGTDRTMLAYWVWNEPHTSGYDVFWEYTAGDGFCLTGSRETATERESTYAAPENATKVRLRVKPISATYMSHGVQTAYWTTDWSEPEVFAFKADPVEQLGTVTGLQINLQIGTDRTLYATWQWSQSHTASYSLIWSYDTGNGIWFENGEETTEQKQATYNAPSNAVSVQVRVRPNSEKKTSNGVESTYWLSDWSSAVTYDFKETPNKPSAPTVKIDMFKLTAEVDIYDANTEQVEFQVVQDNSVIFSSGVATVTMSHATYSCTITTGSEYRVRCRGMKGVDYSEWSEYSAAQGTSPATPSGITSCKALSKSAVEITWSGVANADNYDVEYTTKQTYFDSSNEVKSMTVDAVVQHAEITGLESGEEWFFRVRATNSNGSSGWCSPVSVVLGKAPAAPTTWSQTTTATIGDDLILYWVHNSEDGSSQTYAELELTIGGTKTVETIKNSEDEDKKDETSIYILDTSSYTEGVKIQWRVRTRGILEEYGEWSVLRTIDVYAPPTLVLGLSATWKWFWDPFNFNTDTIYTAHGVCGAPLDVLEHFPLFITATPGPATQKPVGYYLTIAAGETYETVDHTGEPLMVSAGEEIYAHYFDAVEGWDFLLAVLTASDIDLENGVTYIIHCSVYMNSGLTAEASAKFLVRWEETAYDIDMEIAIDPECAAAYIHPYCEDEYGNPVDGVRLSVYRREFDGTYTEIAKDIENVLGVREPLQDSDSGWLLDSNGDAIEGLDMDSRSVFITDPHPALDYARYRIVAMSEATGAISFYDAPAHPVDEISAILQWNEKWSTFDGGNEDEMEQPPWSGSLLRLPWNLDVSDKYSVDSALVEYIGREHPVSYYGTQRKSTSSWTTDVVKSDEETLYQLRRLARWAGDVYVREPSGSGYWANVSVSFSQAHCELVIPVTIDITRVDGGV